MEKTDREGENVMQALFDAVNAICGKIQVVSDLFWEFPTNFGWYAAIPILGNFSLAIILLVGTGIFLTFRFRFVQVRKFKYGLKVLLHSKAATKTGISALAAFLLSTAMRVGPGNILGVTGAISIGGPGALFWMWLSAFFGMSTAFAESTLSQIFKEKRDGQYVGGLPFYGRRLLNNAAWAGVALSVLYIVYAFLCFPAQGFNTISAVGAIANEITGTTIATNSTLYWISFVVLILIAALISFGGIKKVTKVTDLLVPVMAVIYVLTVVVLVVCNFTRIPWFFQAVFGQAFSPDAVFGGAFGTVLSQGIKRGLMSNEAGQGTITMPAAAADANHPCDQGCVQAIGVFLDTIVICTLTALVILCSQVPVSYGQAAGAELTISGFTATYGNWVSVFTAVAMCCFAFSTIIGWGLYGTRCIEFLFGSRVNKPFMLVYALVAIVGATMDLGLMWSIAETFNGLMAIPNLIAVFLLSGVVVKLVKEYFAGEGAKS